MVDWSKKKLVVSGEVVSDVDFDVISSVKKQLGISTFMEKDLYDGIRKELSVYITESVMLIEGTSLLSELKLADDLSLYSYLEGVRDRFGLTGFEDAFYQQIVSAVELASSRSISAVLLADYDDGKRTGNKTLDRKIMLMAKELKKKNSKKRDTDLVDVVYTTLFSPTDKTPFSSTVLFGDLMTALNHPDFTKKYSLGEVNLFSDNRLFDLAMEFQHQLYKTPIESFLHTGNNLNVQVLEEGQIIYTAIG